MGAKTAIEWCDKTFNPWSGCSKVHTGCTNCYAEVNYSVKMRGVKWGPNGTRVKASNAMWKEPLKWNREAQAAGERLRVFCASLADVFEDWQGPVLDHGEQLWITTGLPGSEAANAKPLTLDDLRRSLFALIDATPWLDWLLLTKRPENVRRMWKIKFDQSEAKRLATADQDVHPYYRGNVWLGTSVSDQETADKMVPELLKCRDLCPVLFSSCEPLLGPIDLCRHLEIRMGGLGEPDDVNLQWVIVGGESGHGARECNVAWIRSILAQCNAADIPCFVKQLGSKPIEPDPERHDGARGQADGRTWPIELADKKGGDIDEWPESLRIREFPKQLATV